MVQHRLPVSMLAQNVLSIYGSMHPDENRSRSTDDLSRVNPDSVDYAAAFKRRGDIL